MQLIYIKSLSAGRDLLIENSIYLKFYIMKAEYMVIICCSSVKNAYFYPKTPYAKEQRYKNNPFMDNEGISQK
jgi:hypothetical protein